MRRFPASGPDPRVDRPRRPAMHPFGQGTGIKGPRQQIALELIGADVAQRSQLRFGLDTLGDDRGVDRCSDAARVCASLCTEAVVLAISALINVARST